MRMTSKKNAAVLLLILFFSQFTLQSFAIVNAVQQSTRTYGALEKDAIIKRIKTNSKILGSIAWSPDSKFFAVFTTKNNGSTSILVYTRTSNHLLIELPVAKSADSFTGSLCFSPDGRHLAATASGTIAIWDTQKWQKATELQGSSALDPYTAIDGQSLTFSPDSTKVSVKFVFCLWWPNEEKGRSLDLIPQLEQYRRDSIQKGTFWDDFRAGKIIDHSDIIASFDVTTGKRLFYFPAPASTPLKSSQFKSNLSYNENGNHLITPLSIFVHDSPGNPQGISTSILQIRDSRTGEVIQEKNFTTTGEEISEIALLDTDKIIISTIHATATIRSVKNSEPMKTWDLNKMEPLIDFGLASKDQASLSLSQDRHYLLTSFGKKVNLWDTLSGNLVRTFLFKEGGVSSCAISPDRKTILVSNFETSELYLIVLN